MLYNHGAAGVSLVAIHGTVLCPSGGDIAAFYSTATPPDRINPVTGVATRLTPIAPTVPVVAVRVEPDVEVAGSLTGPDARSWTYTWVYDGDVESRPAPPSDTVTTTDGTEWALTLPVPPAAAVGLRIYRYSSAMANVAGAYKMPQATGYQLLYDVDLTLAGLGEQHRVAQDDFLERFALLVPIGGRDRDGLRDPLVPLK